MLRGIPGPPASSFTLAGAGGASDAPIVARSGTRAQLRHDSLERGRGTSCDFACRMRGKALTWESTIRSLRTALRGPPSADRYRRGRPCPCSPRASRTRRPGTSAATPRAGRASRSAPAPPPAPPGPPPPPPRPPGGGGPRPAGSTRCSAAACGSLPYARGRSAPHRGGPARRNSAQNRTVPELRRVFRRRRT